MAAVWLGILSLGDFPLPNMRGINTPLLRFVVQVVGFGV